MPEKLYYALKTEIGDNQKAENTMITFAYTLIATLLGLAIKENNMWMAMIALVIIIPISYRVFRFRDSIAYIAAYMIKVLEPDIKIYWETNHNNYRQKNKTSNKPLYIISRIDFIILAIASISTFWILNGKCTIVNDIITEIVALCQVILFIIIFLSTIFYSNVDRLKKKIANWQGMIFKMCFINSTTLSPTTA